MRNQIFILTYFLSALTAQSQNNLIPNPSFEDYKKVLKGWSITADDFNATTIAWYSPPDGTSDIFAKNTAIDWWYKKMVGA